MVFLEFLLEFYEKIIVSIVTLLYLIFLIYQNRDYFKRG
ncbi:hypothetical protein HPMG_01329 [Helicobacter pullorum MIT 98-5489]|uniref:Uncharacterized protein n=1 Tax=Helicobacter pullorum MIT 98-5489 TaxID=537972 RepID=C5F0W8_9HELI|nr:hypothetical protein HPMG_01329 [Helicobacter pullorum MIT 98-5489]